MLNRRLDLLLSLFLRDYAAEFAAGGACAAFPAAGARAGGRRGAVGRGQVSSQSYTPRPSGAAQLLFERDLAAVAGVEVGFRYRAPAWALLFGGSALLAVAAVALLHARYRNFEATEERDTLRAGPPAAPPPSPPAPAPAAPAPLTPGAAGLLGGGASEREARPSGLRDSSIVARISFFRTPR